MTTTGFAGNCLRGGRYDGLVEQLGGHTPPAVGFAMGLERMVLLVQSVNPDFVSETAVTDIYLASLR